MKRDSFVFYGSFYEAIKELQPEQQLEAYRAICGYAIDGEEPEIDGIAKAIFLLVRPQIDANNKRYENGKKGGRKESKEESKANQNKTKGEPKQNQDETKGKPNENENVNANDNANDNANENEKVNANGKDSPPLPPTMEKTKRETQEQIYNRITEGRDISPALDAKLREWLKYKAERNERYKETGMNNMVSQVLNRVEQHGESTVIERISRAMGDQWKGMNIDKLGEAPRTRAQPQAGGVFDEWRNAL